MAMMRTGGTGIDVSIVMPCLNEAETITTCVEWALEGIAKSGLRGEVVVSDNGSTDGSILLAQNAGARVVHQPKRGYGNAYLKGFEEAKGDVIVMGDSDATYDFRELPRMLEPIQKDGAEYVLGSRFGGTILPGAMPWLHRYIGNPVLTRILNVFFGYSSSDAHSGFRAFTRSGYERMNLGCEGMEFASEIVIKAARANLKIAEIPIVYHARGGESKLRSFRDGWRHLRFMLLACPKYLFIVPGVILWLLGLIGQTVLMQGSALGSHTLGPHVSALFALVTALGFQLATFAGFAKVHARAKGYDRSDGFDRWLQNDFTLERGLLAGLLIFTFGFAIDGWILIDWLRNSLGPLDQIRPALFAMSLMMTGAQTMFAAFFLSLAADVSTSFQTKARQPVIEASFPVETIPV
jgi:glycosyltransferase involved in cell wall biosynthesis